jgi:hypothetical protein
VAVFITATLVDEDGRKFMAGRKHPPPIHVTNEARYRAELEAALERLGAGVN